MLQACIHLSKPNVYHNFQSSLEAYMKCPTLGSDTEFDHPSAYKIPQAWRWDRNNSSKPIWNAPSLGATPNSIIQALMKCPKVGRAIEFTSSKPIYGHPSLVVFAIWHVFQTSNCICNDPSLYGRPNSSIQAYIRCYKPDVVTNFEHISLYIMMVMLNSGAKPKNTSSKLVAATRLLRQVTSGITCICPSLVDENLFGLNRF